jgi:hypothetical protein
MIFYKNYLIWILQVAELSWSRQQGVVKSGGLSSQWAPRPRRMLTGMAQVTVHPPTLSWVPCVGTITTDGYSAWPICSCSFLRPMGLKQYADQGSFQDSIAQMFWVSALISSILNNFNCLIFCKFNCSSWRCKQCGSEPHLHQRGP